MKNNFYILFLGFIILGSALKAQSTEEWQTMDLNIHDGTNQVSGVIGYCQVTSCNGVEIVLLKLVNLNSYKVKAAWKNIILTKNDERLEANAPQDSVTIAPGGQVVGDCSGNNPRMAIKLNDFGTDTANFATLITQDFDFVIIHN